jgi:hypothetical protein
VFAGTGLISPKLFLNVTDSSLIFLEILLVVFFSLVKLLFGFNQGYDRIPVPAGMLELLDISGCRIFLGIIMVEYG